MEHQDWQGIPSVNINSFSQEIADRLMARLMISSTPIRMLELGYRDDDPKDMISPDLPTPAVLVKFIKIRPQNWMSKGVEITYRQNHRMVVELMFKAYVLLKAGQKDEGEKAQNLAVSLAIAINSESKFGHPVGQAQVTDITPEKYVDFSESVIDCKDSFVVWRVDWFHEALLGEVYTEGYIDDIQVDPSQIKELYLSFDSEKGKVNRSVIEKTVNGQKHRIYKGINPKTKELFESNYVLVSEIDGDTNA